ncbi:MAG: exo-alpha-sialidase [Lentisphaerae bacterium]|nr:exo-alpha-sialidase [Lentisphaerota bacterium]
MQTLAYRTRLDILSEGYDRKTDWFQPRVAIIPPATAVLLMTRAQLWGSDIFTAVQEMRSDDLGRTWSAARPHPTLDRRPLGDAFVACPCDMTPAWHAASRTLLATGHTAVYKTGEKGALVTNNSCRRDVAYAAYDAGQRTWSEWKTLDFPDPEHFYWTGSGCAQRVDLSNGEILLPVTGVPRQTLGDNAWKACYFSTVVRCSFDGATLRYLGHGDELSVSDPRGFCEPSLVRFDGRFFLTLRNDLRGYVAVSRDGLHYERPSPWTFEDGTELGSYNTQQHWLAHSDGLFLVYTRRGAGNDEVIRHRAPLFMAQVDPERLCVVRSTERELVPNRGAQLGNFGAAAVTPAESWVVTTEHMQGDARYPHNLELTERRGANARVYLCRIQWDRPNG